MRIFCTTKKMFSLWSALLFTMGWAWVALPYGKEKASATLDADGRAFTFTMPGVMAFRGSFSATLVTGGHPYELLSTMGAVLPAGQTQQLHSAAGKLLFPLEQTIEDTPCGRATVTEATLRFEREQIDLLVRFSQIQGLPGFQAQTGIRNRGAAPVRLLSLSPVVMEFQVPRITNSAGKVWMSLAS
jgi:hypothetical protein